MFSLQIQFTNPNVHSLLTRLQWMQIRGNRIRCSNLSTWNGFLLIRFPSLWTIDRRNCYIWVLVIRFSLKEEENVRVLSGYLKHKYRKIVLWGRSMGATTALMYCSRNKDIECLILDSPFLKLEDVIIKLIE